MTTRRQARVSVALPCRALSFVLLCGLAAASSAKTEYRKPTWTWRVEAGSSGDFESVEAAFAARNAAAQQIYDRCAAGNCGSCSKTISSGSPVGANARVNGVFTVQYYATSTFTTVNPACTLPDGHGGTYTLPQQGPYVSVVQAGPSASGTFRCPDAWGGSSFNFRYENINGVQMPVYDFYCVKEVPEPCYDGCSQFGNPVDAIAGTKLERAADYAPPTEPLLLVRRNYSSAAQRWSWTHGAGLLDQTGRSVGSPAATALTGWINAVPAGIYPMLGLPTPPAVPRLVSFPFAADPTTSGSPQISVAFNDARIVFTESAPGVFASTSLLKPALSVSGSGAGLLWQLRNPDQGFMLFDAAGALSSVVMPDGKAVRYSGATSILVATSTHSGRSIEYSRSDASVPAGAFNVVTLPNRATIQYAFDDANMVTAVTHEDGSLERYLYDEPGYTQSTLPIKALTGVIDENGNRKSSFRYAVANPISTEMAGGVNLYSFSPGGLPPSTVTTPLGARISLDWSRGPDGERRLLSRSQPAGSGSPPSTQALTYDSGGNVSQRDDFRGNRTCYSSDLTRNLEVSRVEGLSSSVSCSAMMLPDATLPAGGRRTSRRWHPDWRIPSAIAEPGRITTLVYNGRPDPFDGDATAECAPATALLPDGKPIAVLCKRIEQSTTDSNGHLGFAAALQSGVSTRAQTWTYNEFGQVLSATGALGNTSTYTYYADTAFSGVDPWAVGHTRGDLRTATDALGNLTRYELYDKHGNLLQSTDPNGVVTRNTYDLRQRLLSTTVAGQTTAYTYDAAGQLLQVTAADGSWVGYEYDPAHRLVAVKDNLGNRIDYALDNAGNRLAEKSKDAGGVLHQQLQRSIDALGRLQLLTGRGE